MEKFNQITRREERMMGNNGTVFITCFFFVVVLFEKSPRRFCKQELLVTDSWNWRNQLA